MAKPAKWPSTRLGDIFSVAQRARPVTSSCHKHFHLRRRPVPYNLTQESHNTAVPEQVFYAGDTVWAMNFAAAAPTWLPGVLQQCLGPVTFTVGLTDGRVWRRHIDHLRARLPEENVTTTSPRPPESSFLPARAIPPAREDIAEAATANPPPDLSSNDSVQSSTLYRVHRQVKLLFRNSADRQDPCDRSLD